MKDSFDDWRGVKEKSYEPLPADIFNSEQQQEFRALLKEMDALYRFITGIHKRNEEYGIASSAHSVEHDIAVAAFAHAIGRKYSKELAKNSVAAALVHSYDRFVASPMESSKPFTAEDVREWVERTLPNFSETEREEVLQAAIGHDRPNKGRKVETPTVADVLADADKLASVMLYSMVRFGQYLPVLPAVRLGSIDKPTPGATYQHRNVAMDSAHAVKEWLDDKDWFVTPEARRVAVVLEKPFVSFIETVQQQFKDLGIESPPSTS